MFIFPPLYWNRIPPSPKKISSPYKVQHLGNNFPVNKGFYQSKDPVGFGHDSQSFHSSFSMYFFLYLYVIYRCRALQGNRSKKKPKITNNLGRSLQSCKTYVHLMCQYGPCKFYIQCHQGKCTSGWFACWYRKEPEVVGLGDSNGTAKLIWLTKWTWK